MAFRAFSIWLNFIMVTRYKQLLIVFIAISQAVEAFENNEFCQKMAIKHCMTHLRDIFQGLGEKSRNFERCSEFQVMMERKWSSLLTFNTNIVLLLCFLAKRNICQWNQKRIVLPFFCFSPQFQEVINCLSVPRCPGDLLASFRSLLLVTASLIEESSLCVGLKYNDLKRYVAGKVPFSFKGVT